MKHISNLNLSQHKICVNIVSGITPYPLFNKTLLKIKILVRLIF